jgi:uncharacterized protein (TIRG00374 family)
MSGPVARRILALALTAVVLYGLAPAVIQVFGGFDDLNKVKPWWWAAVIVTQVAALGCLWLLQRLCLQRPAWFPVATSQLAGGALGRVIPGGAAAAGALQYRILAEAGLAPTAIATGLAASSLLLLAALAALPILALPALLLGRHFPGGLLQSAGLGLALFAALFAVTAVLMNSDRAVRWLGRAVRRVARRLKRPVDDELPAQLVEQRNLVNRLLGRDWLEALAGAVGRWLFDFLTLLAALQAVDARPRLTLALLAYAAAQLLGQIPITPGGLGVVEAGLTGTLALAGVAAAPAAVATLAYRLASYWLQLPAGLVAYVLQRRRYGVAE